MFLFHVGHWLWTVSRLYFVQSIVSLKKQSVEEVLPHVYTTVKLKVSDYFVLSSAGQHHYMCLKLIVTTYFVCIKTHTLLIFDPVLHY